MKPRKYARSGPQHRGDDGHAFLPDSDHGRIVVKDDLAAELVEEFVANATSGEKQGQNIRSALVTEELGGPFIETTEANEFAENEDESNPEGAEPAAFPTAVGGQR